MFEIGNTLREARLRRGLDISECETGTKIRAKYLRAMEDEHFDLLPSPAYVRGFLRTYAQYLGLDGQLMNDEYESRFLTAAPFGEHGDANRLRSGRSGRRPAPAGARRRPARRPVARAPRRRTEAQLLWLAIGGVMAVALLIWMGVGDPSPPSPDVPPAPAVTTPSDTPGSASEVDTSEAPETLPITLTGTGSYGAYVEVRGGGATGRQVFAGTLSDGQSKTFRVERALWVRTYNAEGLRVTVRRGAARALTGGTGDFLVSRTGVTRLAPSAAGG